MPKGNQEAVTKGEKLDVSGQNQYTLPASMSRAKFYASQEPPSFEFCPNIFPFQFSHTYVQQGLISMQADLGLTSVAI